MTAGSVMVFCRAANRVLNTAAGIVAPHIKPKLRTNAHVEVASAVSASVSAAWTAGRRTESRLVSIRL
jgi:hypothetical protein